MKTVLFGGTFDPIHLAHVQLAEAALRQLDADDVWFLISPQNPWKADKRLTDDHHRLAMVRLALEGHRGMVASDYEFHLPKPSYTYQTLRHLRHDYPAHEFVLLIGGDNWAGFDKWAETDEILAHHRIAIYPRPGCPVVAPSGIAADAARITVINAPLMDVSSTEIRRRFATGEDVSSLLDNRVEDYIRQNNVYLK